MSQFKNNPLYTLFYTDTDSIIIDKPLDSCLVSSAVLPELGLMKLENVYKDFVAIAPKVYGGITPSGEEFTKVKGFKNSMSFDLLKSFLTQEKIELNHDK